MKNLFRIVQFIAQWITIGLALAFLVTLFAPHSAERLRARLGMQNNNAPEEIARDAVATPVRPASNPAESNSTDVGFGPSGSTNPAQSDVSTSGTTVASYSSAVKSAAPAVVSIKVNKVESKSVQPVIVPSDPRLREAFGAIPAGPPQMRDFSTPGLGSGVIFNENGYVLTNYHVVKGATAISAVFQDGRNVSAKLVGSDEETDLAVLRVEAYNTPTMEIAKDAPAVGDVVLAIGSPFGLDKTVTMGIVSAVGRVNPSTGEDLIQTDAAINAGNSGGALINSLGQLVGINSNNYSPVQGGGNVGIGFAIPVAMAKKVLNDIVRYGHVVRGWMGATYNESISDQNDPMPVVTNGAVITAVTPDGPAAKAGLQPGDVIVRFNEKWVPNVFALHNRESHMDPGTKVTVQALRNKQLQKFELTLEEKPAQAPRPTAQPQT